MQFSFFEIKGRPHLPKQHLHFTFDAPFLIEKRDDKNFPFRKWNSKPFSNVVFKSVWVFYSCHLAMHLQSLGT